MSRRRPKRYGPVQNRGVFVPHWAKGREPKEEPKWYTVPAGTVCSIRLPGEKSWRAHRTTRDVACYGYLWRNEGWYGLRHGDYEIKVRVGAFREGR